MGSCDDGDDRQAQTCSLGTEPVGGKTLTDSVMQCGWDSLPCIVDEKSRYVAPVPLHHKPDWWDSMHSCVVEQVLDRLTQAYEITLYRYVFVGQHHFDGLVADRAYLALGVQCNAAEIESLLLGYVCAVGGKSAAQQLVGEPTKPNAAAIDASV